MSPDIPTANDDSQDRNHSDECLLRFYDPTQSCQTTLRKEHRMIFSITKSFTHQPSESFTKQLTESITKSPLNRPQSSLLPIESFVK